MRETIEPSVYFFPFKERTRYEEKFFAIMDQHCLQFDPATKEYSLDWMNTNIPKICEKFKAEIIENATSLFGPQREQYLTRISRRIININEKWISPDDHFQRNGEDYAPSEEVSLYCKKISLYKGKMVDLVNSLVLTSVDKGAMKILGNPIFKPESIEEIFDILKVFFVEAFRELLIITLKTGNVPPSKLIFMGNGNMLLDFLKQLMRGQFLTIAVQRDMEIWISQTFEYYSDGKSTAISPKYASKYISGNERAAEGNRLIDIVRENGKLKIVQLELTSREQI